MSMNVINPVQTTPYGVGYKIKSRLWAFVNKTIFRWSLFFMRKYRVLLLRMFGAKIHMTCSIDRTATIIDPWNLTMSEQSSIGEYACIRCRDKITIGKKTCIGRDVYLLTASHNIASSNFEQITAPISIGDYVWVATRSTVGKGCNLGEGCVVAAESLVVKDVEPWMVVGGNPAKVIKRRIIKD